MTSAARAVNYGGSNQHTWALLNEIVALLGTTKQAMWPFFENTGIVVAGLGAATNLVPRDEVGAEVLEDEFTPRVLRSGITYMVRNGLALNHNFSAGDNAAYSFTDGADDDDPFTMAIWVAPSGFATVQSLFSKYVALTEEYDFRIDTSGFLELEIHDVSVSADFTGTGTVALDANRMQLAAVTYDGNEAAPVMTFYINGQPAGAAATVETGTYVGMENTATPLLIAASGLTAAPTQEYDGWFTKPMVAAKALTAEEHQTLFEMSSQIVGV